MKYRLPILHTKLHIPTRIKLMMKIKPNMLFSYFHAHLLEYPLYFVVLLVFAWMKLSSVLANLREYLLLVLIDVILNFHMMLHEIHRVCKKNQLLMFPLLSMMAENMKLKKCSYERLIKMHNYRSIRKILVYTKICFLW